MDFRKKKLAARVLMETKKEKTALTVDWEGICERCGRCCYEKYDYRGKIFQHTDTSL